jgi:hypothetical protein
LLPSGSALRILDITVQPDRGLVPQADGLASDRVEVILRWHGPPAQSNTIETTTTPTQPCTPVPATIVEFDPGHYRATLVLEPVGVRLFRVRMSDPHHPAGNQIALRAVGADGPVCK